MDVTTVQLIDAAQRAVSPQALSEVFARSGIRRPVDDLERLGRMLDHANLITGAWAGELLIGVARGWTDFSYCCYLSDLAVDRAWQRKGIGKALLDHVRRRVGDEVTVILLAAPEAADYYGPLGFEHADNAWRLPRRR